MSNPSIDTISEDIAVPEDRFTMRTAIDSVNASLTCLGISPALPHAKRSVTRIHQLERKFSDVYFSAMKSINLGSPFQTELKLLLKKAKVMIETVGGKGNSRSTQPANSPTSSDLPETSVVIRQWYVN